MPGVFMAGPARSGGAFLLRNLEFQKIVIIFVLKYNLGWQI